MSERFPGGIISKTAPVPTGPYETGTAPGVWTLDQQAAFVKQGIWPLAGNVPNYIEDVFQTWLYSGTGASLTITNGVDLSGKGGLTWIKNRTYDYDNALFDTARGANQFLSSNLTQAQASAGNMLNSFNNNGFTLGTDGYTGGAVNASGSNYASWTFREQAKFFDVVTYTGNGVDGRQIAHNLGSAPGFMIVKRLNATSSWPTYHRSLGALYTTMLNLTDASYNSRYDWVDSSGNPTAPTSSVFSVSGGYDVNANGGTYVAYLFAHDAGGFGLSGTDNVISCGSFTTNGSGSATVSLGYEPQYLLMKRTNAAQDWFVFDTMRGFSYGDARPLYPNTSGGEASFGPNQFVPTATGFTVTAALSASSPYIYIAIRRGPMKVPTSGTSVFGLSARTGTGADATVTGGAGVSDAVLIKNRGSAVNDLFASRLTGKGYLVTSTEANEVAAGTTILQANPWDVMDGVKVGTSSTITNASSNTYINYLFDRAPSFFDVVCYTGTGSATTVTHNLTVVPEMMIVKKRNSASLQGWNVYNSSLGASSYVQFDLTNASNASATRWNATTPTSSVFSLGNTTSTNASGVGYIWYGFATCAGVSKVGSYTGNGSTQTIDCGFGAGGARFVLIKRTDSTGDWYVYDTARGMTTLTDPYWLLNTTAAEAATLGSVTTVSTGFALNSTILAAINAFGGTYIFLAIA